MKTKLVFLLAAVFTVFMTTGLAQASLRSPRSNPTRPLLPPANPAIQSTTLITPTQSLHLTDQAKPGDVNQHTLQAADLSIQGRPKQVYAETDPASTRPAVYIVQLADAPLATYQGDISGLPATSPRSTGASRLDVNSPASVIYSSYLAGQRAAFTNQAAQTLGRSLTPLYQYDAVFNGLAITATPAEAAKLLDVPGVVSVQRSQWRRALTGDSPTYLDVTGIWDGSAGVGATKGEGVIVGVIDSGIWPEHPSFKDDGAYPAPPAKWQGACQQPGDDSLGYTCNNKLIGIRYFLNGYVAGDPDSYDGLFFSGRDDDGHGTHTASTAAGNQNVPAAIYGLNRGLVSGMAPRAHVAAYKGLGPGGGTTPDLVAAINAAVTDGVDVINYSVGSDFAGDPWLDADAIAYRNALEAGVFVATSAGNAGPGPSTVGSPANAPWVTTVGASYFDRMYVSTVTLKIGNTPVATQYFGSTSTPGVSDFRLVNAIGITDTAGVADGKCLHPFAPGTFQATDAVLCERGDIATWAKGNFVNDGGAGAVIFYNSSANHDFNAYLHPIPSVALLRADGLAIRTLIQNNPGQTIRVSFTQGSAAYGAGTLIDADTVAGFSSRGPNINETTGSLIDVLKPDVTAPGLQILAGASPQHISEASGLMARFGKQGELFQVIQGTSMSSPHIAGLGALLKAIHPNWTPAEIRSALMSTALTTGQQARDQNDADNPATPFDIGAGRILVTQAVSAGFVLDESAANFTAADPALSGNPAQLNLASLVQSRCLASCTWTRTLSSTQATPVLWNTAVVSSTAGLGLAVQPASFTLTPYGTQVVTITANVSGLPLNQWLFAEVQFTNSSGLPSAHFPAAMKPVEGIAPAPQVEINTRRNQGRYLINGMLAATNPSLTATMYLGAPVLTHGALAEDPTNGSAYDNLSQVFVFTQTVPASTRRYVVEIIDSTAPDLDLFVGRDLDNDGPDASEQLCASTSGSWEEICDFPTSGASLTPGVYWVLVQNWAGSSAATDDFTVSTTLIDTGSSGGVITVQNPGAVTTNVPFPLDVRWNDPSLRPGASKYGLIEVGPAGSVAQLSLTFNRLADDVTKTVTGAAGFGGLVVPGDTIDYQLNINPEPSISGAYTYFITDTLPAGLAYVSGSASITPSQVLPQGDGSTQLVWQLTATGAPSNYVMTTSADDLNCDTPFGGYVNLANFGLRPRSTITGVNYLAAVDDFYGGSAPFNFFGVDYPDLYFSNHGFGAPGSSAPVNSGSNTALPNAALPNNLIAPFWRDLRVVYDNAANRGVTIAGAGALMFVEFDGLEPAGGGSDRYSFEMIVARDVDDSPNAYEITYAYDTMGSTAVGSVGLENSAGDAGAQYAYNSSPNLQDLIICFDWTNKTSIDYQAVVSSTLTQDTVLTNSVTHTLNAPFTGPGATSYVLNVTGVIFEISVDPPANVIGGQPITYTLTVTNNGVAAASNLTVTHAIPAGLSYVSGADAVVGNVARWYIPTLAGSGGHTQLTLVLEPAELFIFTPVATSTSPVVPSEVSGAIIGGVEADPNAWPWQVAVVDAGVTDAYLAQFCAGSLIADDWVLTAAHCAEGESPATIEVIAGIHTLSNNDGQRLAIDRIVMHPGYNPVTYENDLALLHLAAPADLTPVNVGLVSLVDAAQTGLTPAGGLSMVTGWGAQVNDFANYADGLRQVSVPLVSNATCEAAYQALGYPAGSITSDMLCAGFYEGGKDSCYGDSGGPLVVPDGSGGWKQAGIVSWGDECAEPESYGVYTRVSVFADWLQTGMNSYTDDGQCAVTDGSNITGHTASCQVSAFQVIVTVLDETSYLPLITK